MEEIDTDLENRFTYHPPTDKQKILYEDLRAKGKDLAYHIKNTCPISRETSLALTHLEQAIMWANAAIARNS